MTWSNKWLYTPAAGAESAAPGGVIGSATWNAIHTDLSNALTQIGQQYIVLTAVNFNASNTDNTVTVTLPTGFTTYMIDSIRITGASGTLTTATCGVFTGAGGTGTAIVTSATAVTVATASANSANSAQMLTVNNASTIAYNLATFFFRVQNPQGVAATANVIIHITACP